MPTLQLRADFDRDGRLTGSKVEYEARHSPAGAVLVPNLDADRRRLPDRVTDLRPVVLDNARYIKAGADDELLPLRIDVLDPLAPGSQVALRLPAGLQAVRLRFYDDRGNLLRVGAGVTERPVAIGAGQKQVTLRVEASTLPGAPYGHGTGLETELTADLPDESRFALQVVTLDANQRETIHDTANFSVAPVLFLDNNMRATRFYMCDLWANQPSLEEVRTALSAIGGIELVTVPDDVAHGDTWLQDQFQPGIVVGADGWRHLIIHLPRLRSNFFEAQSEKNLAEFVRGHFPAHDVGVLEDFWNRTIVFADANGKMQTISIPNLVALANRMVGLNTVLRFFNREISRLDPTWKISSPTWSQGRAGVPQLKAELARRVDDAKKKSSSHSWRAALDAVLEDARKRVSAIDQDLPLGAKPDRFILPVSDKTTMEVSGSRANELVQRIEQMRHSSNYGGNIEVAPPTPDAPLGTIVIGNTPVDRGDFMDPDLRRFLRAQRKQPVVEFNTAWLEVGHIDEVLTFVSDRNGKGRNFAALRASSGLAMRIVRRAAEMFKAGLSGGQAHVDNFGPGQPFRLTSEGTTPVTRLFRGKSWIHSHQQKEGRLKLPDIHEPPRIHQRLAQIAGGGDPQIPNNGLFNPGIYFWPGEGPTRFYPADITVLEVLGAEGDDRHVSVNDFIEEMFLDALHAEVEAYFPTVRVLPLPVLFDRMSSVEQWKQKPTDFQTSAFTPDVVNLQLLNGHLLVPRPYGPRMRPGDAISVLKDVLAATPPLKDLAGGLTNRFFKTHNLTTTVCWMVRQPPLTWEDPHPDTAGGFLRPVHAGLITLKDVVQLFKDGFPTLSDSDIEKRILADNRAHFNSLGELRDDWRRFVIHEDTVDLFEACVQLVADSLGLTVHFVDSWFYHTHIGEIHCGTNVLRVPERGKAPRWWDVPDVTI